MLTLPPDMIALLMPFAPLFSQSVFLRGQVLLVGAILAPGKRTVTAALRAMGQMLFYPPNVKGWDGGAAWLSSATLLTRENFANGVAPNGRFLRINPATHAITTLATGFAAANAIAEDQDGNFFISDSFAGTITKVAHNGSSQQVWKRDVLLTTQGFPPFGANGVAFDRTQSFLYVANTADDRILRIAVNKDGSAGAISIFANGATLGAGALDGADGIQFDVKGNLYVCANQANEIQVLSPSGALIARYGHNAGDDPLDFPASPIFHEKGLYIANLALGTAPGGGKISVLGVPWPGAPSGR